MIIFIRNDYIHYKKYSRPKFWKIKLKMTQCEDPKPRILPKLNGQELSKLE